MCVHNVSKPRPGNNVVGGGEYRPPQGNQQTGNGNARPLAVEGWNGQSSYSGPTAHAQSSGHAHKHHHHHHHQKQQVASEQPSMQTFIQTLTDWAKGLMAAR